jgi:Ca-activated chloride channel family protein
MKIRTDRVDSQLLLIGVVMTLAASVAVAQSGRRQNPSSPVVVKAPDAARPPQKRVEGIEGNAPIQQPASASTAEREQSANTDRQPGAPRESKRIGEEVSADDVIRVHSNLVSVPASVVGTDGRAIANLKLEDFELSVDGERRPLGDLSKSETPVRLALLFDNSSSQFSSRSLEKQAAIRFFRTVVRPRDQAAIYDVYNEVVLAQPLTNDVNALVRTIENFGKPEGATSLFDAIAEAARYLYPHPGRKVIVVVSDGADTTSNLDFETTLRRVLAADCQIYVVQTGHSANANLRDLMAERRMQEFSAQTGGAVYIPNSTKDLDDAFAQISADLAQQYILSYYPKDDPHDGRFRTLSLRVPDHPKARIRARKGYYTPKVKKP